MLEGSGWVFSDRDPELAATGAPGRGSVLLTAALLLGLGAALVLVRQRRARS
ncbi:hypothetical protein [Leucobacter massiliensis]|uniref:hypothetical protein n=1 Tax=Leucobacter massiliensis TaxID=1686285 RepID=UPI0015E47BE0|nr:hypothetical protein [Leucobacter massiliensis]